MKTPSLLVSYFTLLLPLGQAVAGTLGTAFTYQGQLADSGQPATGTYELLFKLYDTEVGGLQIGPVFTNLNTTISNGAFSAAVDFGAGAFAGDARWLAVAVRTNGSSADYTLLTPRQPILPVPYALFAPQAGLVSNTGVSAAALKTPAPPAAGQFLAYSNGALVWTNAGAMATDFWRLGGNSGTLPGNYLGTADNQPLGLRVNGQPALILGTTGSLGMGTCTNVGAYSAALGYQTTARGSYSLAMGYGSIAHGDAGTAIGWLNFAGGSGTALGYNTTAT